MSDHSLSPNAQGDARRLDRLVDGVRHLKPGRARLHIDERVLMVLGGILAPLGLILVVIGWHGAAHTPNLFEQIPYLISGGLFGLGLVFIGAFLYFTHWLTALVKEHRAQSAAVVDALKRLEDVLAHLPTGAAASNGALVATAHGTMAHRPDCIVVNGGSHLRSVTVAEGLESCKLCHPYGDAPA